MKRCFLIFFSLHYLFVWVPSAVGQASQSADYKWQSDGRGGVIITGYNGIDRAITIPNSINGNPVTSIGDSAFSRNQLTSVTIPNSVTSIGEYAFCNNLLASVTIPNSVTSIENGVFYRNQLTNITIPDSVIEIGGYAFSDNQLASVTISNRVIRIGNGPFSENPNLTAINVSTGNLNYRSVDGVLYDKNCTALIQWPGGKTGTVTIPDSVTHIGNFAFAGCNKLTSVTIPDSVTVIGEWAFVSNQLASVTIGNSVISIGNNAFCDNKLANLTIPDSVTSIGYGAFSDNQLISITIGANVKLDSVFYNGFGRAYNDGGKRAGTYTRPDTESEIWTRR
jgi:tRNA G37 N-methylase TrmD